MQVAWAGTVLTIEERDDIATVAALLQIEPAALQVAVQSPPPTTRWGGRYIWQLTDSDRLLVAWNVTAKDATTVESRMWRDFFDRYGRLPFANLRGGRAAQLADSITPKGGLFVAGRMFR